MVSHAEKTRRFFDNGNRKRLRAVRLGLYIRHRAAAAKSPFYGAALLFVFWLGTLPALTAISYAYKKGVSMVPVKAGVIAGVILIAAGLFNFAPTSCPRKAGDTRTAMVKARAERPK